MANELLEQPVRRAETALVLASRSAWAEWTVQQLHKMEVPQPLWVVPQLFLVGPANGLAAPWRTSPDWR
jgi:hypothetical protein